MVALRKRDVPLQRSAGRMADGGRMPRAHCSGGLVAAARIAAGGGRAVVFVAAGVPATVRRTSHALQALPFQRLRPRHSMPSDHRS